MSMYVDESVDERVKKMTWEQNSVLDGLRLFITDLCACAQKSSLR